MSDFSSLMEIAFGLNLALPLLREWIVISRLTVEKRLAAVEKLARLFDAGSDIYKSDIAKVRRKLIAHDADLQREVGYCGLVTFFFSLNSLYWLFYSPFDPTCINIFTLTVSVLINFVPVPATLLYLNIRCNTKLSELKVEIAKIMTAMGS